MALRAIVSAKKQKFESIILFLIIIIILFAVYKNFSKDKIIPNMNEGNIASFEGADLYPPFTFKMQNILEDSKFISLEVFDKPIKESGVNGNSNPFLPFAQ